ncbi:MAG: phosphate ABC transporter permease subunit PstC [Methylacidiphilales bacterium]|nr:phosphate ABC transporter permease subunit PstC [Candidatus Methylacidiphilales bacterium]
MSAKTDIKRLDQRPMHEAVLSKNKFRILGLSMDQIIHYFFFGNAWIAILVLGLITFSLFREGLGFFPQNYENLQMYRQCGLEFVDIIKDQAEAHSALTQYLDKMLDRKNGELRKGGMDEGKIAEATAPLAQFRKDFDESSIPLQDFVRELTQQAAAVKERWGVAKENSIAREQYLKAGSKDEAAKLEVETVDFRKESEALKAQIPRLVEINQTLKKRLGLLLLEFPASDDPKLKSQAVHFKAAAGKYINAFPDTERKLANWSYDTTIPVHETLTRFLFGPQWVTQSFWQDWYGMVPLFVGSLAVSVVALVIAVPLGVGAAVYINQVANIHEQNLIKPFIEFIAVIPSVVLGFFGVAILGTAIRDFSNGILFDPAWVAHLPAFIQWLPSGLNAAARTLTSWVPFFPISERLNIITAGILLALMGVPAIFTFSEDALNNVPKSYKEASFALGANRLQTILRILIPASLSGIISAVLLGFGRVIGETMVVLLCAGNRIQIPDFTQGLGFIFQPVHTMTGLVAQEIPEVVKNSLQYRALFMLAIMLFLISLLINYIAQVFVRKFKISVG